MGLHAVLPFAFADRRDALKVVGIFDVELDLAKARRHADPGPVRSAGRHARGPAPVPDLRQILAMCVDVMLVFDELVTHRLFQIRAFAAEMGQFVHDVLHQMEAIVVVLHTHVKRSGDRSLFLVAPDMQVPVCSTVGQPMDERGIAVEIEYDRTIPGEERVVGGFAEPMRMLRGGWSRIRSTTLMTRIFKWGRCSRRIDTAARTSSVGVSPQQAITTSGSASWSLLAHCQMPMPSVQWMAASSMVSHCGARACLPRRRWRGAECAGNGRTRQEAVGVRRQIDPERCPPSC